MKKFGSFVREKEKERTTSLKTDGGGSPTLVNVVCNTRKEDRQVQMRKKENIQSGV
jgi:hypothetical protein